MFSAAQQQRELDEKEVTLRVQLLRISAERIASIVAESASDTWSVVYHAKQISQEARRIQRLSS